MSCCCLVEVPVQVTVVHLRALIAYTDPFATLTDAIFKMFTGNLTIETTPVLVLVCAKVPYVSTIGALRFELPVKLYFFRNGRGTFAKFLTDLGFALFFLEAALNELPVLK